MAYGFTHDTPYTDFHELNLDWIIEKFGEYNGDFTEITEELQKQGKTLEEVYQMYTDILSGDFPKSFLVALDHWLQDNAEDIFGDIVKMVFFGLTQSGYFVAYIPDRWEDLQFGTTGYDDFPAGVEYGHLTISY